jgi:AcrR family transcriptional regulator
LFQEERVTDPSGDRRHQRSERTRAGLVAAALELFDRQGFDETTVEQIAQTADVSTRTFFHHFPTKEAVLFDGYAERLDDATRRFRSAAEGESLWQALRRASGTVAEAIAAQPDRFARRGRLYVRSPTLRATMLRINEEWIDGLRVEIAKRLDTEDEDLRPRLAASLGNSAMRAAIDSWTSGGGRGDIQRLAADAMEMIRPAIDQIEAEDLTARPIPEARDHG